MKFKLDENFGRRTADLFVHAGHAIETVVEEGLGGASDRAVFEACRAEDRCLVSLDLDFSDVTRFPPHDSGGIAVIRCPRNPTPDQLNVMISRFLSALSTNEIVGRLWIIELTRIRVHASTELG